MARCIARAVVGVLLAGLPLAGGLAVAPAPAHAQDSDAPLAAARTFDPQSAADAAVAKAIAWGGDSASRIAGNITRLILNNPAYVRQIVRAIVRVLADPATPAGLAEALGHGVGAAVGLARGTAFAAALDGALQENRGGLALDGALVSFASGVRAGKRSVQAGTNGPPAGIPARAGLDAVLADFASGLPVDETGTISRN